MEGREQGMNREMDKDRVLLVEDDGSLIDGLEYALKKDGFEVEVARSVEEFGKLYTDGRFDVVLLDVSLPDGNGFEICERIRRTSEVPILFLTAADEEFNVVRGLDMGGDDYVSKPFRLNELLSRIHSLQRRAGKRGKGAGAIQEPVPESGGIRVDLVGNRAWLEEEPLELTAQEYRLLCLFLKNQGMILTRERILDRLWDGNGEFVDDNTLSVYIRRLRSKIEEEPSSPKHLLTVRGLGYQWKE